MAMKLRPSHPAGQALGSLADRVGAVIVPADHGRETVVTGVTLRSQDVQPGDLFAALPGASSHGGRYAADAIRRGAVAVLTDRDGLVHLGADATVPVLVHADPRSVLGGLAAAVYGDPSRRLRVIGVTGTKGSGTTWTLRLPRLPRGSASVAVVAVDGSGRIGTARKLTFRVR